MRFLLLALLGLQLSCSNQTSDSVLKQDVTPDETAHCEPESITDDDSTSFFERDSFRCKVAEWIHYYGNVKRHERKIRQMDFDRRLGHLSRWRAEFHAKKGDVYHISNAERVKWMKSTYGNDALGGLQLIENGTFMEYYDNEMLPFKEQPGKLAKSLIDGWMRSSGHARSLLDSTNVSSGAGIKVVRPRRGVYRVYGFHSFTY